MSLTDERVAYLLEVWTGRQSTAAEEQELFNWLADNTDASLVKAHIQQLTEQYSSADSVSSVDWENLYEKILQGRKQNAPVVKLPPYSINRHWVRYAAAVLIVLGLGTALVWSLNTQKKQSIATTSRKSESSNDINAPASNRATITLANGQKVFLDSVVNGELAKQGNIKLVKLENGQISYQTVSGEVIKEMQFNTLINPRGSRVIFMTLSDGSRVWLDAGSSVTYPVSFVGKERRVTITGEAYFEVAHDASMPFIVSKDDVQVEVLGTHFNFNAHEDETSVRTTLLEGSVKIRFHDKQVVIKPGQQAQLENSIAPSSQRHLKVEGNIDIEQVMAWKNGSFVFNRAPLSYVLTQLSRWYDVEIVYEQGIPDIKLGGEMKRDLSLSQALKGLGQLGVNFRIEGKKLFITNDVKSTTGPDHH
jgi:transmembrane sensor